MNGGFKYEVGMFGGSFDPLHQGHLNVIYRAASECRELYLVLSHSPNRDSVCYRTRAKWLHLAIRHLDNVRILLLEDGCKSKEEYNTSEHWAAGARQVQEQVGKRIDVVYCGSDHAAANEYALVYPDSEIKFVDRAEIPVSSTEIRKSPSRFWDFLPEFVRPQYVRKVLIVGSESTGKSVMARTLANLYSTVCVEEYGRRVCEACGGEAFMSEGDFEEVLYRHKVEILEAAKRANKVLFVDTDALTTYYFRKLGSSVPSDGILSDINAVRKIAGQYDLVLYLDADVPFVADSVRVQSRSVADTRAAMNAELKELYRQSVPTDRFKVISGDYASRLDEAKRLVDNLIEGAA